MCYSVAGGSSVVGRTIGRCPQGTKGAQAVSSARLRASYTVDIDC